MTRRCFLLVIRVYGRVSKAIMFQSGATAVVNKNGMNQHSFVPVSFVCVCVMSEYSVFGSVDVIVFFFLLDYYVIIHIIRIIHI